MSVYDELFSCIETARSTDACEYNVYSEMFDLIAEAEAEYVKLKDLVRDAWGNGHPDKSCEGCELTNKCHESMDELRRCYFEVSIERRMRDLGIEVD